MQRIRNNDYTKVNDAFLCSIIAESSKMKKDVSYFFLLMHSASGKEAMSFAIENIF